MNEGAVRISIFLRDKATAVIKKLGGAFKGLKKSGVDALKSINKWMGNAATRALQLGTAMGVAAAVGMAAMVAQSINNAAALDKMSQRIGVSVEELSTLQFAAEQSGASLGDMELAMKTISRTAVEASQGTGEALGAFKALGIEVTDSSGAMKSNRGLLDEVADAMSGYKDSASKSAAAQRIFGESGTKLIPLLNQSAKGIRALQDEAREFGAEVSTNTARQAAELADNINRLQTNARGVANVIGAALLPGLVSVSNRMVAAAKSGGLLNAIWAEGVVVMTKMQQFITGNEDGMKGLQEEVIGATHQLERLRSKQKDLLEEEPSFFGRSGAEIVRKRVILVKAIQEQEAKVSTLNAKFNKGLALAGKRRQDAIKLQREAEKARAESERLQGLGKSTLGAFSTTGGAGGGGKEEDPLKRSAQDTEDFYTRMREQREQDLQNAVMVRDEANLELMGERERLMEHYDAKLEMARGFADAEQAVESARHQALRKFDQEQTRNVFREKARQIQAHQHAADMVYQVAQAAGLKSHAAQKAMAIGQAIMSFQVAKMKALAEGGPLAGPALIAAVAGMALPIIGALKGAQPGGGAAGGFGGGGGLGDFAGGGGGGTGGGFGGIPDRAPVVASPVAAGPTAGTVILNVSGNLMSRDYVRGELMDELSEAGRMGFDIGRFQVREGRRG